MNFAFCPGKKPDGHKLAPDKNKAAKFLEKICLLEGETKATSFGLAEVVEDELLLRCEKLATGLKKGVLFSLKQVKQTMPVRIFDPEGNELMEGEEEAEPGAAAAKAVSSDATDGVGTADQATAGAIAFTDPKGQANDEDTKILTAKLQKGSKAAIASASQGGLEALNKGVVIGKDDDDEAELDDEEAKREQLLMEVALEMQEEREEKKREEDVQAEMESDARRLEQAEMESDLKRLEEREREYSRQAGGTSQEEEKQEALKQALTN